MLSESRKPSILSVFICFYPWLKRFSKHFLRKDGGWDQHPSAVQFPSYSFLTPSPQILLHRALENRLVDQIQPAHDLVVLGALLTLRLDLLHERGDHAREFIG